MAGVVYIVGVEPGDPGLMTVKGLMRLGGSEVVIHDRLIDQRVLREAKPDAEIMDLGKQFTVIFSLEAEFRGIATKHPPAKVYSQAKI